MAKLGVKSWGKGCFTSQEYSSIHEVHSENEAAEKFWTRNKKYAAPLSIFGALLKIMVFSVSYQVTNTT